MKTVRKTPLVFLALCLAALALFCAGCKKNSGWKAQSAPRRTGSTSSVSSSSGEEKPVRDDRPTSVGVGSVLHDLFGTSLPADTDRHMLPQVDEQRTYKLETSVLDGDIYGNTFYYLVFQEPKIYAYDLETEETRVLTEDVENPANLCVDADGLYVADVGTSEVVWFSFDGERLGAVDFPEEPTPNPGVEGYAWGLEKYYASLCHYDGLLLLAGRDAVWTIRDGDSAWQRAEYPFLRYEKVDSAAILSRDRIAVATERSVHDASVFRRVTEMNRDGSKSKLLSETWSPVMCAGGGQLYSLGTTDEKTRLFELSTGTSRFVGIVNSNPERTRVNVPLRAAVSGSTLFVLWMSKEISLSPVEGDQNAVKILAPESELSVLQNLMDSIESAPCAIRTQPDAVFFDKISASLMASEADFDIAMVSVPVTEDDEAVTRLLRAILKNGQFADLSGNAALSAHLDEAYPGLKEFIAVDGKPAFLPLEIGGWRNWGGYWYGFTDEAQASGISLPSGWKLDDLDGLVPALAEEGFSLFPSRSWQAEELVVTMAFSAAQAGDDLLSDDSGAGAEDALKALFARLTAYRDADVLTGSKAFFAQAGRRTNFVMNGADRYALALPPVSGKNPAVVTAFLFVNPKSERLDQALSIFADLTNEENRYNARLWRTPLYPDATRYYKYEVYNPVTDEWYDQMQKIPAFGENLPFVMKLDRFFAEGYFSGSEPCFLTTTDRATGAVGDFLSGKMTGEDCAKVLYQEFVYKLKG